METDVTVDKSSTVLGIIGKLTLTAASGTPLLQVLGTILDI